MTAIAPTIVRPYPPDSLRQVAIVDDLGELTPAHELSRWIGPTFLEDGAPLINVDHGHLRFGHVAILWTNVENRRQGRRIVGTAEVPMARGGKWAKLRHDAQLRAWFGAVPDFLITLSGPYCAAADDASFCALVEHELYHCGQERDPYGAPKFAKSGLPSFALRGHDVEEFVGVVRRYGPRATGVEALVDAANQQPLIGAAALSGVCGTCLSGVS